MKPRPNLDRNHLPQAEPLRLTGYDLAHLRDEQGRFNLNSVLLRPPC